jgi:hypothetical protein
MIAVLVWSGVEVVVGEVEVGLLGTRNWYSGKAYRRFKTAEVKRAWSQKGRERNTFEVRGDRCFMYREDRSCASTPHEPLLVVT